MEGALSLVSHEHHFRQVHQGLSLGGRPQLADLARSRVAVALGEVGRLLHTITLREGDREKWGTDWPLFLPLQSQGKVLMSVSTLTHYILMGKERGFILQSGKPTYLPETVNVLKLICAKTATHPLQNNTGINNKLETNGLSLPLLP